jgi:hypothetical protein
MAVLGGSTRLLTVAQVAERLSVSESWVRHNWRAQGMKPSLACYFEPSRRCRRAVAIAVVSIVNTGV